MAAPATGRITSILSVFIPVIFGILSMPAAAAAAPPSGRVAIVNAKSGLCLTIAGGVRDNNAEVVQFPCDDHPSRYWSFTDLNGTDVVEVTNLNSGLCLTIAGGVTGRNARSVQYTCDSDPSRHWRLTTVNEGTFRLVNVNSGLCLTIAGGGTDRNTAAVQYPCDGDPSRDWQVRIAH
jgi:cytolethal distending toxin subunit A